MGMILKQILGCGFGDFEVTERMSTEVDLHVSE